MRPRTLLFSITSIASARVHQHLYGIPRNPSQHTSQVAESDPIPEIANGTVTNSTGVHELAPPIAPATPAFAEPCAIISTMMAALPIGASRVVPAQLGLQCLQSVPLDTEGNIKLLEELNLYLEWQSNIAYLRNPPAEYTEDPIDILGGMEDIKQRLNSGDYLNEYDFQQDLTILFNKAYDNHFSWQSDILGTAMQFQTAAGTELISISSDGIELPRVYLFRDIQLARNDRLFEPSPVLTINNREVNEFLNAVAEQAGFHDADTRYNALFPNQAITASGVAFRGSFRAGRYQTPNTTFVFENGTSITTINIAAVFGDFTGVDSGPAFFNKFCQGNPVNEATPTTAASSTKANTESMPSQIGYPSPVAIHPELSVAGYYLDGNDYQDIAILSIPSYESPDVNVFQALVRDFIRMAKDAGKAKLVFDLRGNGGGHAMLGYDTFKQVFPRGDQSPFGGTRYRTHEALDIVGRVTEEFSAGRTYAQNNETAFHEGFAETTHHDVLLFTSAFNYDLQLDANEVEFPSWQHLLSSRTHQGDNFSKILRYNFSDTDSYAQPGFSLMGYLNNSHETKTPQPFDSENMVMLHDGMCSSTCAIVSELLKTQGGVRTIAVGGQPKYGPMQGIGGTKGAQSFEWDDIQIRTQMVYYLGSPEQQAEWNNTALGKTAFATQIFKRSAYFNDRPAGGINLRDNLRRDDPTQTPLEFVYEAADCRMFYTAEMIHDVKVVWKAVVDRMFRGEEGMKLCVRDSTMHKSSISGGFRWSSGEVPDGEKDIDTNGAAKSGTVTLRKGSHWFMVICCIVGGALFW